MGNSLNKILKAYEMHAAENLNKPGNSRGPVKSRLGFKPYDYKSEMKHEILDHKQTKRANWGHTGGQHQSRFRPDYSKVICNYCKNQGHIQKKCFKPKNIQRDAINLVDTFGPEQSADEHIRELLERMRTRDSECEEEVELQCMQISTVNNINSPCLKKLIVVHRCL